VERRVNQNAVLRVSRALRGAPGRAARQERDALTRDEVDVLQLVRPLRRRWRGYDMTDDKYFVDSSICERQGLCHQR